MTKLIKILGTEDVPHNPTELEMLAEEVAQNHGLELAVKENGLVEQGWLYYYGRKGENNEFTLMYDLYYFTGIEAGPIIPFEEAKQKIRLYKKSGNYEEQFSFFRGERLSFSVLYNNNIKPEHGKYFVMFGDKAIYTNMGHIRVLFEEAITCKFLKKSQR